MQLSVEVHLLHWYSSDLCGQTASSLHLSVRLKQIKPWLASAFSQCNGYSVDISLHVSFPYRAKEKENEEEEKEEEKKKPTSYS